MMCAAVFLPALLTIAAPRQEFKLTAQEKAAIKGLEPFGFKIEPNHLDVDFPYGTILRYDSVIGFDKINARPIPALVPSEKDLAPLAKLTRLRSIYFVATPFVNDTMLDLLRDMSQLRHLHLRRTKITDEGLKKLAGLKRLQLLHLDETDITDAGLKALAEFPALSHLHLEQTRVTDRGLKALEKSKTLHTLCLGDNKGIGDHGIESLGKMPNLATLALRVTDEGLKAIAKPGAFPKLTLLTPGDAITGKGFKLLHDPKVLPALKRILLGRTKATEEDFKALLEARPGLEIIMNVPGEGVRFLRAKPKD